MNWNKIGLLFEVEKQNIKWLKSHAMMPLPIELADCIRVFYTGRHVDGRSRISYFDLDKQDLKKILYVHDSPILEIGALGTFDDCGTVGTYIMKHNNEIWLYYNGYNVRNTVPWSNSIGLAVSKDQGENFEKKFEGPVLDRNMNDPYFTISPSILKKGTTWHMWYTSGTKWIPVGNRIEPLYNIKYASSNDGINWMRDNTICIHTEHPEECVARASVILDQNKLRMWFSKRGSQDFRDGSDSYEMGYAEANLSDPTKWTRRDDDSGFYRGPESFDEKMVAYPAAINVGGRTLMFYNGNGFGSQGVLGAIYE